LKKLFNWILRGALAAILLGAIVVSITYLVIAPDLPDVETLRDVRLQVPLRVYSEDGRLISVFGEKRRIPVRIEDVPEALKQAFIAGEDSRFYKHPGVDYQGERRRQHHYPDARAQLFPVPGKDFFQKDPRNFPRPQN
jgi:penicillin-binding protein 1A